MMKVLAFDTSSKALSVAVLNNMECLATVTINIKKNHSINLMPAIDFLMQSIDLEPQDLDRIVVAEGPGSYTGLRVAVATAKMLAYTLKIDLVGVSSLHALTNGFSENDLLVPLIDARRNNVYVGFYQNGDTVKPDCHTSLEEVLQEVGNKANVHFVGEVAAFFDQIKKALPHAKITETLPCAVAIGRKGQKMESVNVDAFVPRYLKRVEAEENWLKNHCETNTEEYIKRV
ncbi:tRNA (adenosine(37)-N6)-threonylcarbamoyltransferase complex dimerization subunit type 1 TsaB [Streptococcus agalactiae]|uniref:tRNA (adenosine(37)-N6)-threonylcarbamoyltransferase complex dimerization subunit type 1 TsaB n=1 Tax=Streptococcus agalactiae TaxID=1311 RepID=UPI002EC9A7D0|nr:tRNA (adenosine(37)-N6)-threonylcarbamoyltransferase complex dimerization subunit type 1 TsaB [Streptococcus agalactiae]